MKKNNIIIGLLCGGKGLRLRPITADIPKPLVEIKNIPILEYIIKHLNNYQFNEYLIATGYKSNQISKFMKNKFYALNYNIINTGDVSIIARIRSLIERCSDSDIILCYGDTISNVNPNKLIKFHLSNPTTMTVTSYPISIPFGVMEVNSANNVKSYIEKPVLKSVMNIGYFYIPKSIYNIFYKYNSFEKVLTNLTKKNKLKCFQHNGIHITINTIAELEYANKKINEILK